VNPLGPDQSLGDPAYSATASRALSIPDLISIILLRVADVTDADATKTIVSVTYRGEARGKVRGSGADIARTAAAATLRSAALVNRLWCAIALLLLWRRPP
jgi:hypothetical protein